MKFFARFVAIITLVVCMLPVVAWAQTTLPEEPGAIVQAILEAITGKNWTLVFIMAMVGVIWVVRHYGAKVIPFLGTSEGGAVTALVTGFALYLLAVKVAGQPITLQTLTLAITAAWTAAGGWTVMRKLLALIPWPWLQALVGAEPKSTT